MNVTRIQHDKAGWQRQGFSLIEMLVVISIITLLISITLPALNTAREQARRTQCSTRLSNLTDYALALSVDNLDALPDFHNDSGIWSSNLYVSKANVHTYDIKARDHLLRDLGVNRDFLYCPSNDGYLWNRDDFWTHPQGTSVWGYIYLAAAPKGHAQWTILKAGTDKVFPTHVGQKSRYDIMWSDNNRQIAPHSWWRFDTARGSNHFAIDHPAGTNNAFVDGHVAWSTWQDMNPEMIRGNWKFWW